MNKIVVLPINTGEIAASGSFTSEAIDLGLYANESRFSLQYHVTGDGTLKIEVWGSSDGINFVDLGIDVDTDAVKTGGPGSDGKYAPTTITMILCRWIKLYYTEVGGGDTVTAESYLAIQ